jgi:hypothetical protein
MFSYVLMGSANNKSPNFFGSAGIGALFDSHGLAAYEETNHIYNSLSFVAPSSMLYALLRIRSPE